MCRQLHPPASDNFVPMSLSQRNAVMPDESIYRILGLDFALPAQPLAMQPSMIAAQVIAA